MVEETPDEPQPDDVLSEGSGEEPAGQPSEEAGSGDDPVPESEGGSVPDDARASRILKVAEALAERYDAAEGNRYVFGELVVHYPARDVVFLLDFDAAARVMLMFAEVGKGHLADELHRGSEAQNMWVVADLDTPMAMSWVPGRPKRNRVTVDPRPPAT